MAIPRPYGRGLYGTGPYSRYGGNVWEVGGATSIAFNVTSQGVQLVIQPWAVTAILWDVWSEHLAPNWMLPAPCEPGVWTPADPCEAGAWAAPGPCSTGTWSTKRLVGS
jgi:hypothetical protein